MITDTIAMCNINTIAMCKTDYGGAVIIKILFTLPNNLFIIQRLSGNQFCLLVNVYSRIYTYNNIQ